MKTYMVDVTLDVRANSPEDAWGIANAFCEASLRSPDSPEGVQVEYVSEAELVE